MDQGSNNKNTHFILQKNALNSFCPRFIDGNNSMKSGGKYSHFARSIIIKYSLFRTKIPDNFDDK